MPSEPDPKNHYSYEEMISRLRDARQDGNNIREEEKSFDPETGKVTVRRRKRKRTGGTSGKLLGTPPLWQRVLRRTLILAIPVVLALVVLIYVVQMASVGTGVFAQGLGDTLGRRLSLPEPVRLQATGLRGRSVQIGRAEGHGPTLSMIKSFALEGAEMHLAPASFLMAKWDVERCTVRRGGIRLGPPGTGSPVLISTPEGKASGIFLSDRPAEMNFRGFSVWDGMILFGAAPEDKAMGFRNVRCSFTRHDEDGAVYFDGQIGGSHEGRLNLPGWPTLGLESIRMQIYPDHAFVRRAALRLPDPSSSTLAKTDPLPAASPDDGRIEIAGTIPLQAGGTADLKVEMRNITLGSLLPKGARTILNEKSIFETETTQLTWESTDPELTWKLAGHASFPKQAGNPPLRIQSISLIPLLSRLTNSELAESLEADLCGLDFSVTPTGCTLENINMVANAKFRLLGSLRLLADGSLDGKLKLGIAPDLMVTSEAPPFFAKGQDGYFWADVSLSGPVGAPVDDLSERITKWLSDMGETAPGGKSLPEPGEPGATRSPPSEGKPTPETPAKNAEDLFRSLTEKPDAAGAKPRPKSQGP